MSPDTLRHETFTLERIYPNCPAHVWSFWSIAEKKAAWFGAADLRMDFRPGGAESSRFHNEMGEHVNETRYLDVADQERIIYAYSMAVNGRVHTASLATVTFEDADGGTRVRFVEQMCVIPPSDGMEGRKHGWEGLLEALGGYLAADTPAS